MEALMIFLAVALIIHNIKEGMRDYEATKKRERDEVVAEAQSDAIYEANKRRDKQIAEWYKEGK